MTMAVCYKCGEIKFGAFCPCDKCGEKPETEDDLIISLAMTDHQFDMATLEKISETIKKYGLPPDIPAEEKEQIRELFRECGPIFDK